MWVCLLNITYCWTDTAFIILKQDMLSSVAVLDAVKKYDTQNEGCKLYSVSQNYGTVYIHNDAQFKHG